LPTWRRAAAPFQLSSTPWLAVTLSDDAWGRNRGTHATVSGAQRAARGDSSSVERVPGAMAKVDRQRRFGITGLLDVVLADRIRFSPDAERRRYTLTLPVALRSSAVVCGA